MGAGTSSGGRAHTHAANDFELVIRGSKYLEHVLTHEFGARGSSIHELLNSLEQAGQALPIALSRRLRYIATMRNKIVHDGDCDALPDRARFVAELDAAVAELDALLAQQHAPHAGLRGAHAAGGSAGSDGGGGGCVVC